MSIYLTLLLDKLPLSDHKIYFARTFHARFFPTRHAFEYPVLYVGVDLDKLSSENVSLWSKDIALFNRIFAYNKAALFSIFANDYLGDVRLENNDDSKSSAPIAQSIKEKLFWHIRRHKISTDNLKQIELITTPRFFGYAFNPVSFYFCYDNNKDLAVIVLEVNNTFGEKHLYVLSRDKEDDDATIRRGYDMSFTFRRSFHVSPFNDRKGFYRAFCKIPSKGKLDMRLVMYTELSVPCNESESIQLGKKKMVAVVSAASYPLSLISLCCAMITYPLDVFLTMPRIMKEAYKLHYQKRLGIFHRPNPTEGTVVKLEPNFIDRYAQQVTIKYLHELVAACSEPISITIHLPPLNKPPIHISNQVQNLSHKNIVLHLSNYTFFTNFLFDQTIYRALIVGYFEKAWECNDLSLLLDFFFNFTLKKNNENNFFKNEPLLSGDEIWAAKIRRSYLKSIINGKNSGGLEAKKEFDQLIQKLSLGKSKDQKFTIAIMQKDALFSEISVNKKNVDTNIEKFDFKHIYMFATPLSGFINGLIPLVNDKLHLLPFPPRYLPDDLSKHPIDKIVLTSSASKRDRLQHFWVLFIGGILYKLDAWFWQKTTGFVEGPLGNPFVVEKYIWEGILDLIKKASGDNSYENILDVWEVVYERKDGQLHLIPPVPLTNFPWKSKEQSDGNTIINIKDFRYRLWLYIKTFRETVLVDRNV
ncbi:12565_t:CDS:2 [Ambispora leptoticha]|uniref:12565_t:CDS:1 n=1 Tax=Ambispora leptoticha TaxID=144679 RepID=A0A9N8Z301_9GLOM|nr:12565_t:CDS:2 [Ambispora leptoticha]